MKMSKQTRYNILATKLQNASNIKKIIEEFEQKFNTSAIELSMQNNENIKELKIDFSQAFKDLGNIKYAFRENSPIDKQDNDILWAAYIKYKDLIIAAKQQSMSQETQLEEENLKILSETVDNLQKKYLENNSDDLKDFWNDFSSVIELFKNTKEVKQEKRRELWNKLTEIKHTVRRLKAENHKKWLNNTKLQIEDIEKTIIKKKERIENLNLQIEKCQNMMPESDNEKDAGNINNWISEKEGAIAGIKADIRRLEKKQKYLNDKLE